MDSGGSELKNRIAKVLMEGVPLKASPEMSAERLLEEVSVYHQELEYQNLELRRVNAALEESRAELKDLFDRAPFPYAVLDSEGDILQGNEALETTFGMAKGKWAGKKITQFLAPESQNQYYFFFRSLCKGEMTEGCSVNMLAGGEVRTFKIRGNILPGGTDFRLRLSFYDITHELQSLQDKKMESIGFLAGGVAHDFNNTLAVISGKAEMALLNLREPESLERDLNVILSAARHGAEITRNLLTFARKQAVNPRVMDLGKESEAYMPILRQLVEESVELKWWKCGEPLPVFMDAVQFRQLLMNLVANAKDAVDRSRGVISVALRIEEKSEVVLEVEDNGEGMDPETLEHVFDPFFTTKEVGRGTGLGMATVRGIVTMNHGRIVLTSRKGEGTKVTVRLPLWQGNPEEDTSPGKEGVCTEKSLAVVLVEDREELRTMTAEFLRHLGHRVVTFGDPLAAREEILSGALNFDLLLTDVVMPGISGPELYREVARREPKTAVLFMSGYSAGTMDAHGLDRNRFRVLEKPFSIKELARAISEVCSWDGDI